MIRELTNVKPGNLYAIETSIGYGFFQCVGKDQPGIDVIRVLHPILSSIQELLPDMIEENERYYIKMVVGEAERKKLITFVGTFPLPNHAKVPKKYRRLDYVPHRNIRNWYIVYGRTNAMRYVRKLNESFLRLSCSDIWNDTYLRERLEEGWSLENWK